MSRKQQKTPGRAGGGEGVRGMENTSNHWEQAGNRCLEQAVRDFCIRVLSGNGHPQEVAILPQMLEYLTNHELEIKSRQN